MDDNLKKPDWAHWKHVPRVSLDEAVALSCDIDPRSRDIVVIEGFPSWRDEPAECTRRFDLAARSVGRDGPLVPSDAELDLRYAKFSLPEFGAWAESVSWPLPDEFPRTASKDEADARPLETKERNTLLTIIVALAKAANLDITRTSAAAATIEALTNEVGRRVAPRTIEEHLKRASVIVNKRDP